MTNRTDLKHTLCDRADKKVRTSLQLLIIIQTKIRHYLIRI